MNTILLMAPAGNGGGGASQLIMIGAIMIIFYFFMIRPQMKKTKTEKDFREQIKKGDKIVTIGGIHGKIVDIQERTLIIEVESGVKLRIEKSAVSVENTKLVQA